MTKSLKPKLVLIGNGMAGIRTLEELLKMEPDLYDITVFGSEPHGNYNRIMLSPVLSREKVFSDIVTHDRSWYSERNITLHTGEVVTHINRSERTIKTANGVQASYDRLIVATGSDAFLPPIPGINMDGVIAFRTIKDVEKMQSYSSTGKKSKAVVIGGGLLGLEAAYGLQQCGMDVSVVHILDRILERQLDSVASAMLKQNLESQGINFLMEHATAQFLNADNTCEAGHVTQLAFKDNPTIDVDMVVVAIGIKPNVQLAKESGVQCNRGVLVTDTMQTSDPAIYAVGECAEHRQSVYGLVAPLYEQAKVCANHLAQIGRMDYRGSILYTQLKVTGIHVFSAGDFLGSEETEDIVMHDPDFGIYKKLVVKDNKLIGVVLYGDTRDSRWYLDMLQQQTPIDSLRTQLIFGQAYQDNTDINVDVNKAA